MTPRNRRRLQLILVLGVFVAPALIALVLSKSGWDPGTRSHGEAVLPQRSVENVTIALGGGNTWAWRDREPRMTLIALSGPDCAETCAAELARMRAARILLNRNMDRVRLLYIGAPASTQTLEGWTSGADADAAFAAFVPHKPDTVAALLIESNGTLLLHYPAGFDPAGLGKDLKKVIR